MIVIVEGFGTNLTSLQQAFMRVGAETVVSADKEVISQATKVILPGVGYAAHAEIKLRELKPVLMGLSVPVLGICLGMQLLFTAHAEGAGGDVTGLGILPGRVERFPAVKGLRVPHMGWNSLMSFDQRSPLLANITAESHFYFVHSYIAPPSSYVTAWSEHGIKFPAVISKDQWHGVQFHPEKSGSAGETILRNFLQL